MYRRCSPHNGHFATIHDAGSVLTGAGMFSEHPLHRITKSWRLSVAGNMRHSVGEQKENIKWQPDSGELFKPRARVGGKSEHLLGTYLRHRSHTSANSQRSI